MSTSVIGNRAALSSNIHCGYNNNVTVVDGPFPVTPSTRSCALKPALYYVFILTQQTARNFSLVIFSLSECRASKRDMQVQPHKC